MSGRSGMLLLAAVVTVLVGSFSAARADCEHRGRARGRLFEIGGGVMALESRKGGLQRTIVRDVRKVIRNGHRVELSALKVGDRIRAKGCLEGQHHTSLNVRKIHARG